MNFFKAILAFLKISLIPILFFILVTFPENLSLSALPHQSEKLTPREETQLFRFLMHDKVQKIDALMNRFLWFNGNVMVVKNHKVLYEHANGFANWQTREPLTVESVFELASVSKQFTAIAILILYERNLIHLDDQLSLYIPELPYPDITIRHLLNHTSGLPNYMWLLENKWKETYLPSNEEMICLLVEHNPHLFFKAGCRYNYSNTGYALLASVVERVSGKSFTQFMHENVFSPLDMRNTYTSVEVLDTTLFLNNLALGHRKFWRNYRANTPAIHDKVLGDKGIHSNLEDLFKWDQALYTEKLVSNSTLEKAYKPLVINKRYSLPYGFGFRLGNKGGERYVYHHGLWEGFRTCFIRYIERGDAIIVLNNTNQKVNNQILDQIQEVLEEPFEFSPAQKIALTLIADGWQPAEELLKKLTLQNTFSPKPDEILEIAGRLREMDKPELSSLVYSFFEKNHFFNYSENSIGYID